MMSVSDYGGLTNDFIGTVKIIDCSKNIILTETLDRQVTDLSSLPYEFSSE